MSDQPRLFEVMPTWTKVVAATIVIGAPLLLVLHWVTGTHVRFGALGVALHLIIPIFVVVSLMTLRGRPRP